MNASIFTDMETHIRRYRETGGVEGHYFNGTTCLLLETRGRRSGKMRTVALVYENDNGRYVVVASKGGASTPPSWFLNLQEDPNAVVQVGAEVFPIRARLASEEERPTLWQRMVAAYPPYDRYEQKAGRAMPVLVLEHVPGAMVCGARP